MQRFLCMWISIILLTLGLNLYAKPTVSKDSQSKITALSSCEQQCRQAKNVKKCRCRCQQQQNQIPCEENKASCVSNCTQSCEPVMLTNFVCCTNCSLKHQDCLAAANHCEV